MTGFQMTEIIEDTPVLLSDLKHLSFSIHNGNSDIFIEFTKADCSKCEEMAPVYQNIKNKIKVWSNKF